MNVRKRWIITWKKGVGRRVEGPEVQEGQPVEVMPVAEHDAEVRSIGDALDRLDFLERLLIRMYRLRPTGNYRDDYYQLKGYVQAGLERPSGILAGSHESSASEVAGGSPTEESQR